MKTPEELFWNNASTVKTFASLEVPLYWQEFFKKIKKTSDFRVLDIGCGGGRVSEYLVCQGFDVWANDLHKGMVESTKKRLARIWKKESLANHRVVQASMENLPYEDEFFSAVVANGVYHNATSYRQFLQAIRETSRIMKQGGFLCLNIFYAGFIDKDVSKDSRKRHLFITDKGLSMVLVPAKLLQDVLKKNGLRPAGKQVKYLSGVITGQRSVFRGVWKKN